MATQEDRIPVITRTYEKGPAQQAVWVYRRTGGDISGLVFEFSVLLNNKEIEGKTVASGNKFHIRKLFINHLLDLSDDGWQRRTASSLEPEHSKFFEPEHL